MKLPNKTHLDSPVGGEESNKLIREVDARLACANDKLPEGMTHLEIAKKFDLVDFNAASKLTGNKFVFMKNELAVLELALCNWVLNKVASKGFVPLTTPDLARTNIVEACGFQPRDNSSQIYKLQDGHECLIGTAEIPLAGMYSGEMIRQDSLPHKMVAFSHCFRAEAGRG